MSYIFKNGTMGVSNDEMIVYLYTNQKGRNNLYFQDYLAKQYGLDREAFNDLLNNIIRIDEINNGEVVYFGGEDFSKFCIIKCDKKYHNPFFKNKNEIYLDIPAFKKILYKLDNIIEANNINKVSFPYMFHLKMNNNDWKSAINLIIKHFEKSPIQANLYSLTH